MTIFSFKLSDNGTMRIIFKTFMDQIFACQNFLKFSLLQIYKF